MTMKEHAGSQAMVRPTIRCVLEDLLDEGSNGALREAFRTAQWSDTLLPLRQLEHPVLTRANELASDSAMHREPVKCITDRDCVKVKTGEWRGALWQDAGGQWWLLAVGRRKDDGPGDFYRELTRYERDSSVIAPSDRDYAKLRLEAAHRAILAEEQAAQRDVIGTLLAAASKPGDAAETVVFGARVRIRVDRDEDELDELTVSFEFECFDDQDRFPADVLEMIPAGGFEQWQYLPAFGPDQVPIWSLIVRVAWIDWLSVAVELDELKAGNRTTRQDHHPVGHQHAHYASARVVTLAYVEGVEIQGLCGYMFTPSRDPDPLPLCAGCQEALEIFRRSR
jgi:hypothetical protein